MFHPQILLHQLISNLVVDSILETVEEDDEPETEPSIPPACKTGCCSGMHTSGFGPSTRAVCLAVSRTVRHLRNVLIEFPTVQSKRDEQHVSTTMSRLEPRAPVALQALSNPATGTLASYVKWFDGIVQSPQTATIEIFPSASQIETWRLSYRKGVPIPIGVTASWFPFGDKSQNFKLEGLIGCTGIVAVVS